jgi:hypothetical protein
VPVGHVLVGDPAGNIEHDDTALALDVVTVTETTELLLAGSVPNVEADGTKVGVELKRVDLDTEGGYGRSLGYRRISTFHASVPMYFFSNSPGECQWDFVIIHDGCTDRSSDA